MFLVLLVVAVLAAQDGCWAATITWTNIPGSLKQISVGPAGVWGVNYANNIWYRNSTRSNPDDYGSGWTKLDGSLKQIDVGQDVVWGVNSNNDIWVRTGISDTNPVGTGWQQVEGNLKHVSVSNNGYVWGVNSDNTIFYRNCRLGANACADWVAIYGASNQISAGGAGVWCVNSADQIYYRTGTFGDNGGQGTGWQKVDGALRYVSSGNGLVIGVNSAGQIFKRQGVSATVPTGTHWVQLPGVLKVVDGFDNNTYWGVNAADQIWRGITQA